MLVSTTLSDFSNRSLNKNEATETNGFYFPKDDHEDQNLKMYVCREVQCYFSSKFYIFCADNGLSPQALNAAGTEIKLNSYLIELENKMIGLKREKERGGPSLAEIKKKYDGYDDLEKLAQNQTNLYLIEAQIDALPKIKAEILEKLKKHRETFARYLEDYVKIIDMFKRVHPDDSVLRKPENLDKKSE